MKRTKLTDEQITLALRQAETGTRVAEVRRLKQLEEENRRLKRMVTSLLNPYF